MEFNPTVFRLKKVIGDIKNYNREWYYTHDFQKLVGKLNNYTNELGLPPFQFEPFHYSSSGKTLHLPGYESLLNHIKLLEEMVPVLNVVSTQKTATTPKEEVKMSGNDETKVFIVHGRDKTALLEMEGIVRRAGLEPIVLSRMTNSGLTLIEKFEKHTDVKYAIVLLTPDDIGALYENAPLESLNFKFRARQNVIFELGFFYGRLGRANVSCIYKSTVELPTDINGVAYLSYSQSVEELEFALLRELKDANIEVKVF
jgi:predicted nucleotide-binding protein